MTTGGNLGGEDVQPAEFSGSLSPLVIAAHELKSPLAVIRQLALELQGDTDHPLAEQIRLASEQSLRLVGNLTKAERLQTNLFPTMPVNPKRLCESVSAEMAGLYRAHERNIVYKRARSLPLVVSNNDLLRRILLNFADNALHYSSEAGVVELYSQLLASKDTVRLGVRDYGPALPASLWRDLTSGNPTHLAVNMRPTSSGLGLAISMKFAEVIGAKVGAIRHRDGASFYVDVPVSNQLSLL